VKLDVGGSTDTDELPPCADPRLTPLPDFQLPQVTDCVASCIAYITFDENGVAVDYSVECNGMPFELTPEILACLQQLFAGVCYPSLAGMTVPIDGHQWIA
jgi:hypothetical protein